MKIIFFLVFLSILPQYSQELRYLDIKFDSILSSSDTLVVCDSKYNELYVIASDTVLTFSPLSDICSLEYFYLNYQGQFTKFIFDAKQMELVVSPEKNIKFNFRNSDINKELQAIESVRKLIGYTAMDLYKINSDLFSLDTGLFNRMQNIYLDLRRKENYFILELYCNNLNHKLKSTYLYHELNKRQLSHTDLLSLYDSMKGMGNLDSCEMSRINELISIEPCKVGDDLGNIRVLNSDSTYLELNFASESKPVILFFWDSWCLGSIHRMQYLINNTVHCSDSKFIFISMDETYNKWKESLLSYNIENGESYFLPKDGWPILQKLWVGGTPKLCKIVDGRLYNSEVTYSDVKDCR